MSEKRRTFIFRVVVADEHWSNDFAHDVANWLLMAHDLDAAMPKVERVENGNRTWALGAGQEEEDRG